MYMSLHIYEQDIYVIIGLGDQAMSCYWRNYNRIRPQAQAQAQEQDQDQNQRNVLREIGNVNISIDNDNIAVAILAILAFADGTLDGAGIQNLLNKLVASKTSDA